ncbi:MAG: GTP 3',8-cyclase MoaA [SAR324 cluster bacterium]|nr:GTP 3',8-cyclase MoaA [SAR324 cluster bacterium]
MIDQYHRNINKLRISVTEACNLGCVYCVESPTVHRVNPQQLSSPQILKLVQLLVHHAGIETIRITGGEPLLFNNLPELVEGIAQLPVSSIGLTTSGQQLASKAKILKQRGLSRVNVSIDSVDPDTFKKLTRTGHLEKTIDGIHAALDAGLKVKLNTVVMRGENDVELLNLLEFALNLKVEIRFLELMRMGPLYQNDCSKFVSMNEMLTNIRQRYSFVSDQGESDDTAVYYKTPMGRFGVIANESAPFCSRCSRLRLASDGTLFGCLSHPLGVPIRHLLTAETPEPLVMAAVQEAISVKRTVHFTGSRLRMSQIGG